MFKKFAAVMEQRARQKQLYEAARSLQMSEFKGQSVDYIMHLLRSGEFDANFRA